MRPRHPAIASPRSIVIGDVVVHIFADHVEYDEGVTGRRRGAMITARRIDITRLGRELRTERRCWVKNFTFQAQRPRQTPGSRINNGGPNRLGASPMSISKG